MERQFDVNEPSPRTPCLEDDCARDVIFSVDRTIPYHAGVLPDEEVVRDHRPVPAVWPGEATAG